MTEPEHWAGFSVPAMRHEAHFGDRIIRCFSARPSSFHAMFEEALASHADRRAVLFNGASLSYRELDREVGRIAAGLASHGVERGDRVMMFIGNRPEFVSVLLAIQRLLII